LFLSGKYHKKEVTQQRQNGLDIGGEEIRFKRVRTKNIQTLPWCGRFQNGCFTI